ncbi:AAEL009866-PA [Aedes aegypti]|uniref:AAEL009866-PA n=1 Tax=Aedes aegypti TaxID=7159 RepID=Q16UL7_AEDAE|nr:AAEL009866-PA [Aedes aegypti]
MRFRPAYLLSYGPASYEHDSEFATPSSVQIGIRKKKPFTLDVSNQMTRLNIESGTLSLTVSSSEDIHSAFGEVQRSRQRSEPLLSNSASGSATIFTKEPTVRIQCLSGSMLITIKDAPANLNGQFSGMVYPKGLAKNSTCLTEYRDQEGPLRYKLPLKSCNTMPIETGTAVRQ